jgi:hypothetical protein
MSTIRHPKMRLRKIRMHTTGRRSPIRIPLMQAMKPTPKPGMAVPRRLRLWIRMRATSRRWTIRTLAIVRKSRTRTPIIPRLTPRNRTPTLGTI